MYNKLLQIYIYNNKKLYITYIKYIIYKKNKLVTAKLPAHNSKLSNYL